MKTDADMLQIIIEYAVERGWNAGDFFDYGWKTYGIHFIDEEKVYPYLDEEKKCIKEFFYTGGIYSILFSHSFAKAVFGEEGVKDWPCDYKVFDEEKCKIPAWQYHLQQAVISDNPILYYYNFVTERSEE